LLNAILRNINSLRRPSKQKNKTRLQLSGQDLNFFTIREANINDIPALSALHVQTWNDTYHSNGPGINIRTPQWQQYFSNPDKNSFVLVIEDPAGKFIGFAKAQPYNHPDIPNYTSELNKIYLLREYQRIGLGRKLLVEVMKRLIAQGHNNMLLFGIPQNPTCYFHEAMGGQRLYGKNGEFHGGFCWPDLQQALTKITL